MGNSYGRHCGSVSYGTDQACMEIITPPLSGRFELKTQSSECQKCDYFDISDNVKNGSSFVVNATYSTLIKIVSSDNSDCNLSYSFSDDGLYRLDVETCTIDAVIDPGSPYYPILCAALYFFFIQIIHCRRAIVNYYMKWRSRQTSSEGLLLNQEFSDEIAETDGDSAIRRNSTLSPSAGLSKELDDRARKQSRRLKSLDAFRGLSVALMVFVNYGGGGYWFFNHSPWNGLTVADLVFPWFMWIMGVSMPLSFQSQFRNGASRTKVIFKVVRRSVVLFALGIMVNSVGGHNDFRTFRIPGVLQRFGVAYLVAGTVLAASLPREIPSQDFQTVWRCFVSSIRDFLICAYQWMLAAVLVAAHTALTFYLPVPGCPTGYLGPGGLHDGGKYSNCTGGSAGYLDRLVFGDSHIYNWPTAKKIYITNVPYDPEGLLGCMTSSFIVCLGIQAGVTLLTYQSWSSRVKRWVFWSLIFCAIGGGLCGFSKEDGVIPVNKNLWSLSFVLTLGGMAFFLLTAMYLVIDVSHIWGGSPFLYVGMNPIVVYVGHEVCEDMIPFSWTPFTASHWEKLTMSLWGMYLWMFIAFIFFKKKIFIAV